MPNLECPQCGSQKVQTKIVPRSLNAQMRLCFCETCECEWNFFEMIGKEQTDKLNDSEKSNSHDTKKDNHSVNRDKEKFQAKKRNLNVKVTEHKPKEISPAATITLLFALLNIMFFSILAFSDAEQIFWVLYMVADVFILKFVLMSLRTTKQWKIRACWAFYLSYALVLPIFITIAGKHSGWWVCYWIYIICVSIFCLKLSLHFSAEHVPQTTMYHEGMTGEEYEDFVMHELVLKGYKEVKPTPRTGDFGADILAITPEGHFICFQCKKYQDTVGVQAVQEVIAAKEYYSYELAAVVTNSHFTSAAKQMAAKTGVKLYENFK